MDGLQIVAVAPLLAILLCVSLGNCCMTRGLRATIQHFEQRLHTLETVVPARPTPPQHVPLQQPPLTYYYPQPPYPSAPRKSTIV